MTRISRISEVAAAGKKSRAAALRVMDYLQTGNEVTREADRGDLDPKFDGKGLESELQTATRSKIQKQVRKVEQQETVFLSPSGKERSGENWWNGLSYPNAQRGGRCLLWQRTQQQMRGNEETFSFWRKYYKVIF
jgi:hypothetical protein